MRGDEHPTPERSLSGEPQGLPQTTALHPAFHATSITQRTPHTPYVARGDQKETPDTRTHGAPYSASVGPSWRARVDGESTGVAEKEVRVQHEASRITAFPFSWPLVT